MPSKNQGNFLLYGCFKFITRKAHNSRNFRQIFSPKLIGLIISNIFYEKNYQRLLKVRNEKSLSATNAECQWAKKLRDLYGLDSRHKINVLNCIYYNLCYICNMHSIFIGDYYAKVILSIRRLVFIHQRLI